jgi:hypothetical protein
VASIARRTADRAPDLRLDRTGLEPAPNAAEASAPAPYAVAF